MFVLPGSGGNSAPATVSQTPTVTAQKGTTTRPRPPALWSVHDVVQWFERHCGDLGIQYSELFLQNNISGRTLLQINSAGLERMGISNPAHLHEIWREIIKLKLKSDILELVELRCVFNEMSPDNPSMS